MCFHYSLTKTALEVENRYQIPFDPVEGYYNEVYHMNGFTYAKMPVISNEDPKKISMYNWGFIPKGTPELSEEERARKKELKQSYYDYTVIRSMTLNAKSEEVFEKKSFMKAVKTNRCLIPADGFFESREVNKKKYPHYITVKNHEIFSMAGIWDIWKSKSGNIVKTFSILTCPANPLLAKIHNGKERMPVILPRELEMNWLKKDLTPEEMKTFFLPYPEEEMEYRTVSKDVNNAKINSNIPTITNLCEYVELPPL